MESQDRVACESSKNEMIRNIDSHADSMEGKAWWERRGDENDQFSEFFTRFGSSNKCRLCPFMVQDTTLFGQHIREEHTECERFQCKFCIKEFFHLYKCMNHVRNSHYSELQNEKENCRLDELKGHPVVNPYKNCYTVITCGIEFQYIRANSYLYEKACSEDDEPIKMVAPLELEQNGILILESEKVTSDPITVDLTLDVSGVTGENISQNSSMTMSGDYEIVDEQGNIFVVNSETGSGNSSIMDNSEDPFAMPNPIYDIDDEDSSNLSSSNSNMNSDSFFQFHYPQDDVNTNLMQPEKQKARVAKKPKSSPDVEYNGFKKPMFSYSQLIYLAFKNSVDGFLFVSQVYLFVMEHFPYYKSAPSSWKNSIRHTLCGSKCFLKGPNSVGVPGDTSLRKNMYWTLSPDPGAINKMEAEIEKVISRNTNNLSMTMPNPENITLLQHGQMKRKYSRFGTVQDSDGDDGGQLGISEAEYDHGDNNGALQVQLMDPSDIIPTTSFASATNLTQALSSGSGNDAHSSSRFRLVDNGVGLELQPMDEDPQAPCMYYLSYNE